jgi:hypothetical protein
MKICITSLFTDEIKNETYWATLNKKKYCDKYNIFYRFYYGRASKRHAQWDKIQCVLQNILEYDYVIWMDSDTIINNFDISFYDIIEQNKNFDAIFCRDICYSDGVNHLLINTGVMIFKNTPWCRQLLIDTWNGIDDYEIDKLKKHSYDGFPHEQGIICNILLKENPNKFIIHDPMLFNTHPNISNDKTFIIHYMGSRENEKKLNQFIEETKKINKKISINNDETFNHIELKKLKICVVSHYTEHIKNVAKISIPNKENYCNKHEYFIEIHEGRLSNRHPAWDKIKFIQSLLHKNYDYFVWIDNDAIIIHDDYRFDFICCNYHEQNMIICSENNQEYFKIDNEIDFNKLENLRIVNSGVFILKNNVWTKKFLEDCWNINTNTNIGFNTSHKNVKDENINYNLWPFEQGAIHIALSERDDYVIIKNKIMNSFKHQYERYEFICHFVGEGNNHEMIDDFIKMVQKKSFNGEKIKYGKSIVDFKNGYAVLSYDIYKTSNTLYFHYKWDLTNLGLEHLSHHFKIITNTYEREIPFNSIHEGNFEIEQTDKIKIMHTYEYYGEKKWYDLIYL